MRNIVQVRVANLRRKETEATHGNIFKNVTGKTLFKFKAFLNESP